MHFAGIWLDKNVKSLRKMQTSSISIHSNRLFSEKQNAHRTRYTPASQWVHKMIWNGARNPTVYNEMTQNNDDLFGVNLFGW